jgi:hypothetical protein
MHPTQCLLNTEEQLIQFYPSEGLQTCSKVGNFL